MSVLVDTSVWIDFFQGAGTPQVARLKGLVGREEILLGDLILAEILQGVKDDQAVAQVEAAFSAYRVVPLLHADRAFEPFVRLGLVEAWQKPPGP